MSSLCPKPGGKGDRATLYNYTISPLGPGDITWCYRDLYVTYNKYASQCIIVYHQPLWTYWARRQGQPDVIFVPYNNLI